MAANLNWTQMKSGTLNAHVGPYHLFSVAWHTGEERWFVAPKLRGQKTVPVTSPEEGIVVADQLYQALLKALRLT